MAIVTYTLNADAFGTGDSALIADFDRSLLNVPTTTSSDVSVNVNYNGDFFIRNGGAGNEFRLNIEGVTTDWFIGGLYTPWHNSFTFTQAAWQSIIADGTVTVTFDMGDNVRDYTWFFGQEEYIHLSFTWDSVPIVTPGKPDPILLSGTSGDDFLPGTAGSDLINAGAGNDSIFAGNDNDTVKGGIGDDVIGGGKHADALYGEQGDDTSYAGDGDDSVYGGIGDDSMFGGTGHDSLFGGDGNDTVYGSAGNDLLKGADGNDLLGGGAENDDIHGGAGNDTVFGGEGNDTLFGNMGKDALFGGAGKDILEGGLGDDELSGGAGADTFIFGKAEGNDVIRDFEGGRDILDLNGQTYTLAENADGFTLVELSGGRKHSSRWYRTWRCQHGLVPGRLNCSCLHIDISTSPASAGFFFGRNAKAATDAPLASAKPPASGGFPVTPANQPRRRSACSTGLAACCLSR